MKKKNEKVEKLKLVIDSDVSNEIDDQFALSYALSREDFFDIEAITIAPFRVTWQKNLNVREGMIDSKNEAERILRLFGKKWTQKDPIVLFGAEGFLSEGYKKKSAGVEKIIKLAKKYDDLYICALGTLTNVAMVLHEAPKLAKKLHVVWMGTDNLMLDRFQDTNYAMDKLAFQEVIASDVDLTIFPTYMARGFVTSKYEFERNITSNSVTKYLASIINKFQFTEENMGLKTIYDIGPISYLLNKDKFITKEISPKVLVKEGKVEIDKDRKVTYITAVPKHYFIWTDFLKAINSNKEYFSKPKIFFTSDTHFGDDGKIRKHQVPFKDVEEMDSELVRRWNSKVGPNDIVYHLGDFGNFDMVKKLNGKVVLICGNYEADIYRKNFDDFKKRLLALGFADVIEDGLYLDEKVMGEKVYLTHKPGDRVTDCKTMFGHVHGSSLVKPFGFNVAVAFHYFAPLAADTAKRYLNFVDSYTGD